jgi:hypothetical protein
MPADSQLILGQDTQRVIRAEAAQIAEAALHKKVDLHKKSDGCTKTYFTV